MTDFLLRNAETLLIGIVGTLLAPIIAKRAIRFLNFVSAFKDGIKSFNRDEFDFSIAQNKATYRNLMYQKVVLYSIQGMIITLLLLLAGIIYWNTGSWSFLNAGSIFVELFFKAISVFISCIALIVCINTIRLLDASKIVIDSWMMDLESKNG